MAEIQQRYATEAAKRQREDGLAQFQELHLADNDRLRHLVDDPYADHAALDKLPPPLKSGDRIKFLIVGAGMGGILSAIRLVEAGFSADQIRFVEVAGGIGGTWWWNRYPGLHCDIESYIYLPMLEEMGYVPPKKYESSVGIRNYLISMAKKYELEDKIMFRTQLDRLQWDESIRAWKADLTIGRGEKGHEKSTLWVNAEFVYLVTGIFPRPQVPKLPGITAFEGAMFHTSRWNYDVTGGSSDNAFPVMDKLKGKRVGVIGTGATAVQIVPELAKYAEELYVFQRTPSQVNVRGQRDTDPAEWKERVAHRPGWQKERMENFAAHMSTSLSDNDENLVGDAWTDLKAYCAVIGSDRFGVITRDKAPEHIGGMLARDAPHTAAIRKRVAEIVKDKETAERLTPWYPTWCKRPTFSDVYLQTFNQPNVHLVDTDGKGVDSIRPTAIVANRKDYPIDILVFSTGYRSPAAGNANPATKVGVEVVGRNGRVFSEKWASQGPTTLHGCCSNGFPNLFWLGPAQTGVTANFAHPIDVLARHISFIVGSAHDKAGGKQKNGVVVEPMVEAEEQWSMLCMQGAAYFGGIATCTPGYMTGEGDSLKQPATTLKSVNLARPYFALKKASAVSHD
ncbi:pyridine nucleotide-disulfide oxidoreductase-like protein [Marasmius fiardii PR-910]|nr:pyridine nucleotide-disulfide oxidoreductase-like protein [Marasmius fiardii PR-910]